MFGSCSEIASGQPLSAINNGGIVGLTREIRQATIGGFGLEAGKTRGNDKTIENSLKLEEIVEQEARGSGVIHVGHLDANGRVDNFAASDMGLDESHALVLKSLDLAA